MGFLYYFILISNFQNWLLNSVQIFREWTRAFSQAPYDTMLCLWTRGKDVIVKNFEFVTPEGILLRDYTSFTLALHARPSQLQNTFPFSRLRTAHPPGLVSSFIKRKASGPQWHNNHSFLFVFNFRFCNSCHLPWSAWYTKVFYTTQSTRAA